MNKHVPGLDGLRAISAIAVAIFHLGFFQPGWIGVQVFYVISGFLITGILLDSKQSAPSLGALLKRFYYRRSLRILPLYLTYLLFILLASLLFQRAAGQRANLPYLATYTYNFYRAFHPNLDILNLSDHLWSLSIEEQFYLAWPLAVFFLSRKAFTRFTLIVIAASPLLRASLHFMPGHALFSAYFLTPYQLDGFAAGALLSTLSAEQIARIRRPFVITMACVAALLLFWNRWLPVFGLNWLLAPHKAWIWGYTFINLCGTALIVECLSGSRLLTLLEWAPLRYIGRISYGFYVWHVACLLAVASIFMRLHLSTWPEHPSPLLIVPFLALTTAVSALSFRYIEQPAMRFKDRFFRTKQSSVATEPVAR